MAEQRRVKRFHRKNADSAQLRKGGRKADSQFYRRHFRRKKIAGIHHLIGNTDLLVIVASFHMPELKPGLVDRFLILTQLEGVEPLLLLNKVDLLADAADAARTAAIWREVGVEVIEVSAETGQGIAAVKEKLAGRRCAVVGHSGAGKTSILRRIDPAYLAAVQEVSAFTKHGKHTTTVVRMHSFTFGGEVYDMPGLKEIDFMALARRELDDFYPEFTEARSGCHYKNCSHTRETACGVRAAVEAGTIHPVRYQNYLQIYESLPE